MKKLGKIHLRTIEESLSESEMKFVAGGSGYGYGYGWEEGVKPCPENGCPGPRGALGFEEVFVAHYHVLVCGMITDLA